MGLFKKSGQVIDLTKLQKKGILQRSREIASINNKENLNSGEVIDLRSLATNESVKNNGSDNSLEYLGSLAGFGTQNLSNGSSNTLETKEFEHLKIKVEDLEYKLDRLIERLDKIESKIDI